MQPCPEIDCYRAAGNGVLGEYGGVLQSRLPGANEAHSARISRYVAYAGEAGGRQGGAGA
jgi:hypothetical protein